ncbi:MAG: hypothetical protein M0036_07930 [Desulfobacteraceae bacterium]|nr:hypothetical protein [Desulfobacteraceae bacterium]
MKRILLTFMILLAIINGTATAWADINEEVSFTNYTNESLYVELAVEDYSGWVYYGVYVEPGMCSYANLWADLAYARYSACAYGEVSDDFYGCIDGALGDGYQFLNFDNSGYPYSSAPPDQSCDAYMFDNPNQPPEVLVVEEHVYHEDGGAGCFIGAMGF